MKKSIISSVLVATMVAGMMAGCGNNAAAPAATQAAGGETVAAAEEGKVLNICVWNTEWKERVEAYYPGYTAVDDVTGTIGDVTVNWLITASTDNAYQNNLDERLLAQANAAADEKVDIFLVEADYALKYVDTEYTMAMSDLGLGADVFADQFQYTKDVVTFNGQLKGSSWQGCPGVLVYRRDIAEKVLGVSEPEDVQAFVKDWDTFKATSAEMKKAGYYMTSSVADSYRVFSNNVTTKWVEGGKVNIDANLLKWVEMSKAMVDNGETQTFGLWGDDWSKGFYMDGNVFCYFGPAWLIDFCMACDQEGSVGQAGQWGATEGPQGFFWGGTWVCAATGTDNATLVADIIKTMTADEGTLKKIVLEKNDFCNDQSLMDALSTDDSISNAYLGGQNALGKFSEGVKSVDLSKISAYDQGCNESFQNCMNQYFDGNATYDEAIAQFQKEVAEKYPELTF